MSSPKLNPKNIVIQCDFSNGHCFSKLTNDDFLDLNKSLYDESVYFPIESRELKVFITNSSWMLNKKQQVYTLEDYRSVEAIESAFNNRDEGKTAFIRTDLNNLKEIKTSCYFSRYKNTDLFQIKTSNHQNSACPGDLYFKPFIGDLNKLNTFDKQAINLYDQLKTHILIKSIFIFLAPFLIYLSLGFLYVFLFTRLKKFVITGKY